MADEKILLEIEVDVDRANQDVERLTDEMVDLNNKVKTLNNTNKNLEKQGKQNSLQYKDNAKQLALLKSNVSNLNKERANSIKSIQANTNSYGAMKTRLNEVARAIDKVDLSTKKGQKQVAGLRKEQARLNTTLKKGEAAGNSFGRNVGNYTDKLGQASPAAGSMINSIKGLTSAAMAFIATPLGLVLAAVAAAVGTVVVFFKRTVAGGDKLAKVMGFLSGTFEALLDIIAAVGKIIIDSLVTNFRIASDKFTIFIEQFNQGILELRIAFNKLIDDQEEVNKLTKELEKSQKKEAEALKSLNKNIKDNNDRWKENTKDLQENIDATEGKIQTSIKLATAERNLKKFIKDNTVAKAENNRRIFEGLLIAKDETKSFEERRKGLEKAAKAQRALAKLNVEIAQKEFEIAKEAEANNNSTLEDKQALKDAEAKVIEAKTAALRVETKIQSTRNTLRNQEKAYINKQDNEVKKQTEDTLKREQNLADQRQVLYNKQEQKRIEGLGNTQEGFKAQNALFDTQYQVEKERIEREVTDEEEKKIKLENLAFDTEQQKYQFKVEFYQKEKTLEEKREDEDRKRDEVKLARKKQIASGSISLINEVFNFAKVIGKKDAKLQQDLGIAQAVINTAVGVTKALSIGPAGIPAAAGIAIKGATQIATIKAATPGSGDSGSGDIGSGALSQETPDTSRIDDQISQQEALQAAIANLGLTVSVTEINEVQNAVQVSEQTSQI